MIARYFLDTNIIIYAHTNLDLAKQQVAQKLIDNELACISTQILQETANTFSRKLKKDWIDIDKIIHELVNGNVVHKNSENTILKAMRIAATNKYSFYDCSLLLLQ